jgi:hypothetical protein
VLAPPLIQPLPHLHSNPLLAPPRLHLTPSPLSPHPQPHPRSLSPSHPSSSLAPIPVSLPFPPSLTPLLSLSLSLSLSQAAVVGELAKIASHIENSADRQKAYCKANAGKGERELE